jgi:cytochrome c peroxidase
MLARAFMSLLLAAIVGQAPAHTAERRSPPLGLDLYMPIPEDNPLTPEKIALGRRLFSDRLLSRDGTKACRSCHEPKRGFTDGRPVAVGVLGRTGSRNVPTLINRGYGRLQFLDGRVANLEEQVLQPIVNPKELNLTIDDAVARLARTRTYGDQFEGAFGRAVNAADLARALASYVRSIVSGNSPYDRFINGERTTLSAEQQAGLRIFRGKGNCTACHVGPTFTDEQFHNTGIAWREPSTLREAQGRPEPSRGATASTGSEQASAGQARGFQDLGRFAVTGRPEDQGAFKTPTLREIARTAPYMHDGSLATLEEVIDFYNGGGRSNPRIDPEIRPLHLPAEEKQALIAFLKSLSGSIREGQQ